MNFFEVHTFIDLFVLGLFSQVAVETLFEKMDSETAHEDGPIDGKCGFYVKRKKRHCKMLPVEGNTYCAEHLNFQKDNQVRRVDLVIQSSTRLRPSIVPDTCYV